jgi:ferredoxin-NADP reductase
MKATLTKKVHEYDDVYTFFFDAPGVRYKAGQYAHLKAGGIFDIGAVREMSFASVPGTPELMFSMHVASKSTFKQKMAALLPGDTIRLFGIGGHISLPENHTEDLVFIAGGVGMTPFRSMILEAKARGTHTISLIQVQRGDFLYRKELAPLVSDYHAVRPEEFIDAIKTGVGRHRDGLFYVCGSKRLVTAAVKTLREMGIRKDRIQIEEY